jgi:hypothetical protein
MIGPGKYDDLCTEARVKAKASGALLIIIGGERGLGFSVQAELWMLKDIPDLLRKTADLIEKEDIPKDFKSIIERN